MPVLRSAPAEVNPAGSPADQLGESEAEEIRAGIVAACDALAGAAGRVPPGVRPPSAARACRAAVRSARLISGIYQAPAVPPADDGGTAAARPSYLDAGTPAEMGTAIGAHLRELLAADPTDTAAALAAAWHGFSLALALGQFLASRSPDLAVPHENAMPAWAQVVSAMDAAPSLPAGVHGLGLDTVPDADPALMVLAHQASWTLSWPSTRCSRRSASTPAMPPTAPPPRRAPPWPPNWATATPAGVKTFLNPLGRPPATTSAAIRTQPRHSGTRRGPASGATAPAPGPDR